MSSNTLPYQPVSGLNPSDKVDSIYHLQSVDQRLKKNGEPFYMLQLADSTGTINCVMWDNHAELINAVIKVDDFVHVFGDVGEYNGKPQLTVKRIALIEDENVDLSFFLPVSPKDRGEMEKELDQWIDKVQNPECQKLLQVMFGNSKLRELYCQAPAAARIHQAYVHGLLEHTLNVMKLADGIANIYEPVNRDILITGTLLHDIGKIRELDWKRTISYTTEGRLLGHIPMGASMVDASINQIRKQSGFDANLQYQIIHLILSHHGKQEWGSPVTPKTREALVLHYADHAEAYMSTFVTEVDKATEKGEAWTNYSRMFESYLYTGENTMNGQSAPGGDAPPANGPVQTDDPGS